MYIDRIIIENYKSYLAPQEIQLTPGFNVIVGANNVGKTALVEALSLQMEDKPHASIVTIPMIGGKASEPSVAHITFVIDQIEMRQLLLEDDKSFYLRGASDEKQRTTKAYQADLASKLFSLSKLRVVAKYQAKKCISATISDIETDEYSNFFYQIGFTDSSKQSPIIVGLYASIDENQWLSNRLAAFCSKRIYCFKAERFNVGQARIGQNSVLKPNASNLAQVLNLLQTSNPARFSKLVEFTEIIFPDIKHVTIPPTNDSEMVKILLWYFDLSTERQDLAIALEESGTGISQVLAILYVVITSDFPRPIIIDEPQSFLHPAAIRKLFSILSFYPKHQYIITTHSPLVISVTNPTNLLLLRKKDTVTQVEKITISETAGMNAMLQEVGARLSDVFGAENILWVEGATEENSFPLIIQKIIRKPLAGTAILGVVSVGDFENKKNPQRVLDIYQRLSKAKALVPAAIGFIFDREGRSETEQADLERQSNGQIHFLSRRMYENYLLNPAAIIAVIATLDNFGSYTLEDVQKWMDAHRWDHEYYSSQDQNLESWLINVHAGKFLDALFKELSENRYSYESDKAYYGVELTKWLVENSPDDLNDIKDLLNTVLSESL